MNSSRSWTPEEDELLRQALAKQANQAPINWNQVATKVPHRSNKDCRKRWVNTLDPLIKKGPWEEEEDDRLREGVRQHGTKWSMVSRSVGSRNPDQCSRRWHEVLKSNIDRGRWSLFEPYFTEQDEMLRNAVRAHGRSWIEIVERYFPNRTPIATRHRYTKLCRRDTADADAGNLRTPVSEASDLDSSVGWMNDLQFDIAAEDEMWDLLGVGSEIGASVAIPM